MFALRGISGPCATKELAVVQSLRDLWFQLPDTLRIGSRWQDSGSYPLCRDGVLLRVSVRRNFRISGVAEEEGRTVLALERISRTSFDGEGVQAGEHVTVAGTGTGELTYKLDPASGAIVSATGSASLDLALRNKLLIQRANQTSEIRIVRGN